MGIIALGAPTAVGNALIPPEGPAAIPLTLDFTNEGEPSYTINVGDFMQKGPGYPGLSILQTLYCDLAGAASALVVEVTATGQRLVIPPQTQGYYPIISPSRDYINFACADTDAIIPVYLLNVPVPPNSWSIANTAGGIADAPNDGNEYVRKSGGWVELSQASAGGLADAPDDAKAYVRKSNAWVLSAIQADAPADGNFYGRTNGAWAEGSASGGTGGGGGGGGPTDPNAHRYWRLIQTASSPGAANYVVIDKVYMATSKGGANIATGGTALEDSHVADYAAANAFNGKQPNGPYNPSGNPDIWASNGNGAGNYIGYQFASGENIVEVSVVASQDVNGGVNHTNCIGPFNLQYSDDGAAWTTAQSFVPAAWTVGSEQTFDV